MEDARADFIRVMDDDFNTSAALAAIFELVRAINTARAANISGPFFEAAQRTLRELAGVLGLVVRGRMPAEFRSSMLTRSLVTIALGLVIMVWPGATLEVMAWLVGLGLALFGLAMLWSGRQVGKLAHELEG